MNNYFVAGCAIVGLISLASCQVPQAQASSSSSASTASADVAQVSNASSEINSGKRLKLDWMIGDDGSSYDNSFFSAVTGALYFIDSKYNEPCTPRPVDVTRCLPKNAFVISPPGGPNDVNTYEDASCTQPLAAAASSQFIEVSTTSAPFIQFYIYGAAIPSTQTVYRFDRGVCSPTTGAGFFELGSPVPLTAFEALHSSPR